MVLGRLAGALVKSQVKGGGGGVAKGATGGMKKMAGSAMIAGGAAGVASSMMRSGGVARSTGGGAGGGGGDARFEPSMRGIFEGIHEILTNIKSDTSKLVGLIESTQQKNYQKSLGGLKDNKKKPGIVGGLLKAVALKNIMKGAVALTGLEWLGELLKKCGN